MNGRHARSLSSPTQVLPVIDEVSATLHGYTDGLPSSKPNTSEPASLALALQAFQPDIASMELDTAVNESNIAPHDDENHEQHLHRSSFKVRSKLNLCEDDVDSGADS